jgi:hypothetical protein
MRPAAAGERSHRPHLLHGEARLMRGLPRASLVAGYFPVMRAAAHGLTV